MTITFHKFEKVFTSLNTLNYKKVQISTFLAHIIKNTYKHTDVDSPMFFLDTFCGVNVYIDATMDHNDKRIMCDGAVLYDFESEFTFNSSLELKGAVNSITKNKVKTLTSNEVEPAQKFAQIPTPEFDLIVERLREEVNKLCVSRDIINEKLQKIYPLDNSDVFDVPTPEVIGDSLSFNLNDIIYDLKYINDCLNFSANHLKKII